MLNALLAQQSEESDDKEVAIGQQKTRAADYSVFNHLLRLWTKYPRVLLHKYVDIDDWHTLGPKQLKDREKGFVTHVYLAWLRSHRPEVPVPERGYYALPAMRLFGRQPTSCRGWMVVGQPNSRSKQEHTGRSCRHE